MITELAFVKVHPGTGTDFKAALFLAVDEVLSKSPGFVNFQLKESLDTPSYFCFEIDWETKEDHTRGFRESESFILWRGRIGDFFAEEPQIEHWTK